VARKRPSKSRAKDHDSAGDPPEALVIAVTPSFTDRVAKIAQPVSERFEKRAHRVVRIWQWIKQLKPYRVFINFSHNDGNLLAAGMSYQSLFASFAGIWVGFSVAGIWLNSRSVLEEELIAIINRAIPDLIGEHGLIDPNDLPSGLTFGWTGIIAIIGLLWTAIAWLYYTRQAVRAMFDLGRDKTNYVLQKIRDLGLAFCFGAVLIVSAIVSAVSGEAVTLFLGMLGLSDHSFWTLFTARATGFVIALALNLLVLATMFRLLSRVAIPVRNLLFGSFLGAIALSAVSAIGGIVVGAASRNPLLATFAVFIGLLIWFILICRIILLSASWIAVGMADAHISARKLTPEQREAERVSEERSARVVVARAEVANAEAEMRQARWFGRLVAQRRVERARNTLADLLDEGVRGDR
jgi:membrane protein